MDFDVWHKCFAHPGKEALRRCRDNTQNFPKDLKIPDKTPLCQGCAEGKMSNKDYPLSDTCAAQPFNKIHTDLKELPVKSYHGYKYYILFKQR